MSWRDLSIMDQRREFVMLASLREPTSRPCASVSASAGRRDMSGCGGCRREKRPDRSRRPHSSPRRTPNDLERCVLNVRDSHPAWGARKIARRLQDMGLTPPSARPCIAVLTRHGRIDPQTKADLATGRFEREAPNLLWQMDFKGRTRMGCGNWCYPLTIIDDHSRFAIGIEACLDERLQTVRGRLETILRRYGLPMAIYCDNGNPWARACPTSGHSFGSGC